MDTLYGESQHSMYLLIYFAITALGVILVVRFSLQAFGRPVQFAGISTSPRYMTSPARYRFGSWIFVLFSCSFLLLLVWLIKKAVNETDPGSYSYVPLSVGIVFFYLVSLNTEASWNVLLMMRDMIHRWVRIPQRAEHVIAQIRFSLRVPHNAVIEVVRGGPGALHELDFNKDRDTPERLWAESCYMKWWLTQKEEEDFTSLMAESFGFEQLRNQLNQASWMMDRWRSGDETAMPANAREAFKELHLKFARLVAFYLIYRGDSGEEARRFGIHDEGAKAVQYPITKVKQGELSAFGELVKEYRVTLESSEFSSGQADKPRSVKKAMEWSQREAQARNSGEVG
jgi:hypothetical protein